MYIIIFFIKIVNITNSITNVSINNNIKLLEEYL